VRMRFCRDGRPDDPDPLDPPGGDDLGLADPGGPDLVRVDGGLGALRPRGDPPTPGVVARTGLLGAARSPGSRWRPGDARARRTPPPTYQGTPTTRPALRASTQTPRPRGTRRPGAFCVGAPRDTAPPPPTSKENASDVAGLTDARADTPAIAGRRRPGRRHPGPQLHRSALRPRVRRTAPGVVGRTRPGMRSSPVSGADGQPLGYR
jgi:hypothetical protein